MLFEANDLKTHCSKHFTFADFIHCGETQAKLRIPNLPESVETIQAIKKHATLILDPIFEKFGPLNLTYGLCTQQLKVKIPARAAPKVDQHASYELNSRGNLICNRGGIAADFLVPDLFSWKLACFVVQELPFDRLYYYGSDKPIHVSWSSIPCGQIILMMPNKRGHKTPKRINKHRFQESHPGF